MMNNEDVIITGQDGNSPDSIDVAQDDSGAVDLINDFEDEDNINDSSNSPVNYN